MIDVLVVGGGVVGLSTAVFLARYGVGARVVERHPSTSLHPRARGVNLRTMELYRAVGLEAAVLEAGRATPIALGLLEGRTLAEAADKPLGRWVRRGANALANRGILRAPGSPALPCRVTQDHLEPVLAEAAVARGATVRFRTELVDLVDEGDHVRCTLLDRATGAREEVAARYVVAADGARSPLRVRLGVGTTGRGSLGHLLNILFEADLAGWVRGREFSLALVHRPDLAGLFASIDNRSRWVFHLVHDPTVEPASAWTPDRCAAAVRTALGLDVPVRVTGVLPWEAAARVAERYRVGRVLFAGDAAHLMPPWGGQGANTGIADAWDLAWKLGHVLRHAAPDALLGTYEAERRPVAELAVADSVANTDAHGLMARATLGRLWAGAWSSLLGRGPPGPSRLQRLSGLGFQYRSPAITPEPAEDTPWSLDGRPGTRLPHVPVRRGGEACSTLDLVGTRFTLLSASPAWCAAVDRDMGVDVVRLGVDVADGPLRKRARIGDAGALLVRPDGFVAWRARGAGPPEVLHAAARRARGEGG